MNIIGDVHGRYGALRKLIEEVLPKDEEIILVGDLIDREAYGPEVVQYVINNKFTCLVGNHENMMIDYYDGTNEYDPGLWESNGGRITLRRYNEGLFNPRHHVEWMKTLPYYVIRDNFFISHAPIPSNMTPEQECAKYELLWNRNEPGSIVKGHVGMRQIFGHNSQWGLRYFKFNGDEDMQFYALCLDSSRSDAITAYNTTEDKIYQEMY